MEIITPLGATKRFVENLKLVMEKRGLSYKDLGDICGISKQRVSDLFNRIHELNTSTTDHISTSLGFEETDLFQDDFTKKLK